MMVDELVKTGVDELLDILRQESKIPLSDVARRLNASVDVVQSWVDFLVEERIVGIEYKFTTPFIYLNKPIEVKPAVQINEANVDIMFFKKMFWDKAVKDNIPVSQIDMLWKNHLLSELELKKKFFFFEAQNRKLRNIEDLWKEYQSNILAV